MAQPNQIPFINLQIWHTYERPSMISSRSASDIARKARRQVRQFEDTKRLIRGGTEHTIHCPRGQTIVQKTHKENLS